MSVMHNKLSGVLLRNWQILSVFRVLLQIHFGSGPGVIGIQNDFSDPVKVSDPDPQHWSWLTNWGCHCLSHLLFHGIYNSLVQAYVYFVFINLPKTSLTSVVRLNSIFHISYTMWASPTIPLKPTYDLLYSTSRTVANSYSSASNFQLFCPTHSWHQSHLLNDMTMFFHRYWRHK
jgi:hypothetical protein